MKREVYEEQVALIIKVLPFVANESVFALKGGTAINLFFRNFPRFSVDIDLAYLPIKDRTESLDEISATMNRIATKIEEGLPNVIVQRDNDKNGYVTRLRTRQGIASIKVETSPVARGVVNDPEIRTTSKTVDYKFGFVQIQVVSFEDLFGGKLNAALDRQHPRDLFDVKLLFENEGITTKLFHTFLVYVASSSRPMHELLNPHLDNIVENYRRDFQGMARYPVTLEELLTTRELLIRDIQSRFGENIKRFLLGLHDGIPDFDYINLPQAEHLPAVRWKLLNLEKLKKNNPKKHAEQRIALETLLG